MLEGSAGVEAPLEEVYAAIAEAQPEQQAAYSSWIGGVDTEAEAAAAAAAGCILDVGSGTLTYAADFAPPELCFDLLYCRHGKTTGNTEPRVYQGFVDEPENALNEVGLAQAEEAAERLEALGVAPDLVVLSPLSRASETGMAWVRRHPEAAGLVETWDETAEMRFGAWDNVKVKDLPADSICHLFYLAQNALVRSAAPYTRPADGAAFESESFVQLLTRMGAVLDKLEARMAPLAAERAAAGKPPPLVLMYGHSMAGAALGVLTGNGKRVDGEGYLGFDGKYILPNATPVYLHRCR